MSNLSIYHDRVASITRLGTSSIQQDVFLRREGPAADPPPLAAAALLHRDTQHTCNQRAEAPSIEAAKTRPRVRHADRCGDERLLAPLTC
jgi:hypothetical protein